MSKFAPSHHTSRIRARLLGTAFVVLTLTALPLTALAQSDDQSAAAQAGNDQALQAEVDRSLSDAAATARQSMNDLLASQNANGTSRGLEPVNVQSLPPELQRPVTIAWTGPADEFARQIASSVGYSFLETGKTPAAPDLVVVRYTGTPAGVVLQDLGLRVSQLAQISVDTTARSVTFENETQTIPPIQPIPASNAVTPHHHHPAAAGMPQQLFPEGGS